MSFNCLLASWWLLCNWHSSISLALTNCCFCCRNWLSNKATFSCVSEPPHVRIMRFVQSLYKSSLPQYVLPKKEILHMSPIRFGTCATFSVALFTSSAPPLPLVLFLTFFFTIFVSSTFSHVLCDLQDLCPVICKQIWHENTCRNKKSLKST